MNDGDKKGFTALMNSRRGYTETAQFKGEKRYYL